MNNRRVYDKEFKINSVNFYNESNKTIKEVEDDLGIANGNLKRWVVQFKEKHIDSFPGNGKCSGKDLEIQKLKKECKILKEERDILKKVMGIFSGPQR